ncbi:MAG: TonB-dependent receptor [Bacteroidetes bacterium]|nr:TonB-dependent receptor [Bacteroidota bacterium]
MNSISIKSNQPMKGINIQIKFALIVLFIQTTAMQIAFGQQEETTDKNHNEQVTIIGSFDPSINEAYKVNQKPETHSFSFTNPEFEFNHIDRQSDTRITLEPITPANINVDKREKISQNLLLLGFGSQFSPYLNFFHSSGKRSQHRFTAEIYHLSAFKNIPEYVNPYSDTKAALEFNKFINDHILDLGFTYELNTNRYYGYLPADYPEMTINENGLKQMYNLFDGNIGIRSNYKSDKKLVHSLDISGYYFFDKYKSSEANAELAFDFYKSFEVTKVLNYQYLGLDGHVIYYNNTDTLKTTNEYLVNATPYFKARYGIINFKVGLSFNYLSAGSKLKFYPEIDASVELYPEYLTLYAGIGGGLEKISLRDLSAENPWMLTAINSKWKDNRFIAFGGLRGNLGQKVGYNLEAKWTRFNNEYFYTNIITQHTPSLTPDGPRNKFNILYDNGNVTQLKGEITYTLDSKFKTWLAAYYNIYGLNTLNQSYHKPISEVKLGASYLFANKVNVWTEVYYIGKRYALDPRGLAPTEITLDSFFDVNLGVDYQLKENFSVFLKLTNLLNRNYEYYYQYPVQGINVMAGISYKF